MPIYTKPPLIPTYSLTDRFNDMFGQYLAPITELTEQDIEDAHNATQEKIWEEVAYELPGLCTVEYDENEDGKFTTVNGDRFIDWLFDNYTLEPK